MRNLAGDCIGFIGPCGGGYGDPLDRTPEQVREDVLDDFCTIEHARNAYGVVLTDSLDVDQAATDARRAEMRA
jgi:N-methylhydantoinase B